MTNFRLVYRTFDEEIKQKQEMAAQKWGFDFRTGQPTTAPTCYSWERVSVPEIVPEMYTLTRAAHIREIIAAPTEQDILIDDRSAKENSIDEILSFPFKSQTSPTTRQSSSSSSPSKMLLSCHKSLGKRQPRITGKFLYFNETVPLLRRRVIKDRNLGVSTS